MPNQAYTFHFDVDFDLMNQLSAIDRFGGAWPAVERREGMSMLNELKSDAAVQSVAASTRMAGSSMTEDEVRHLLFQQVKIGTFEDRDQQQALGYFNALALITESLRNGRVSESDIKNLHGILLQFSDKDLRHKGEYKTSDGPETEKAMRDLLHWYDHDNTTPPLIRIAVFIYAFLSIHPFVNGNGRLSRLISTLLLQQHYPWIRYACLEHEMEARKAEYDKLLHECRQEKPIENITPWLRFLVSCLANLQEQLMQKIEAPKSMNQLSPREKMIYQFIENHPGCRSGRISERLGIPLPTVKKTLGEMAAAKIITRHGAGAGVSYFTEKLNAQRTDMVFSLSDQQKTKEFVFVSKYNFIEIKRIILQPKFQWTHPNEWSSVLYQEHLVIEISWQSATKRGEMPLIVLNSLVTPYHYQPVIHLWRRLHDEIRQADLSEFPVTVSVRLFGKQNKFQFDVLVVYDGDRDYYG